MTEKTKTETLGNKGQTIDPSGIRGSRKMALPRLAEPQFDSLAQREPLPDLNQDDRRNVGRDRRRGSDARRGEQEEISVASVNELCKKIYFAHLDKTGRGWEKQNVVSTMAVLVRFMAGKKKEVTQATTTELYDLLVWYGRKHADSASVLVLAKFLIDFFIALLAEGLVDRNPLLSVYRVVLNGGETTSPDAGQTSDTALDFAVKLKHGESPGGTVPTPVSLPRSPLMAPPQNFPVSPPGRSFFRSILAWIVVSILAFLGFGFWFVGTDVADGPAKTAGKQVVAGGMVASLERDSGVEKKRGEQKKFRALRREFFFANNLDSYYCKNFLQSCNNVPAKLNRFSRDTDAIDEGRQIFKEFCERCHGHDGKGFGSDAPSLTHVPGRLDVSGEGILQKDAYLYWTIAEGGRMIDTEMPSFASFLSEKKIWRVIAFIETL